jgi:hypothetical protein
MYRTLLAFLLIVLLAACGPAKLESTQEPLATPSMGWTSIKMVHSGGIMGLLRTIEISRNGTLVVTDDRARKSVNGQLTTTDLSELIDIVSSLSFAPPSKPGMGCADCFIYTLEISTPAGTSTLEANDISLLDSGLDPLVTFLRGVMDSVLK